MSNHTPGRNGKASVADELKKRQRPKPPPRMDGAAAPEQDAGEPPPPWPDIVPLVEEPAVMDFPLEVLPAPLRAYVTEAADAIHCPTDFVAVPVLVIASGAIGMSRSIHIKHRFTPSACLYAAVVGQPGCGKSPAAKGVIAPVREAEAVMVDAWEAAMTVHATELAAYEQAKQSAKHCPEGPTPVKPAEPVHERCTVGDATAESIVPILEENPRGVVMFRDELTAWMAGMNQYREGGKGSDQQFWLSTWSNDTVVVDRKKTHKDGPLIARDPFVSVLGGMTPDKLPTIRGDRPKKKGEQDGFVDRILFCYPKRLPFVGEDWKSVSESAYAGWSRALERLRSLQMVADDKAGPRRRRFGPRAIPLDDSGREAWVAFTGVIAGQLNADNFPAHLVGPWNKLREYGARLSLLVRCLRWACGEIADPDEGVGGEDVYRAARLVTYFASHARKVHAEMDSDPVVARARKLVAWIVARREPSENFSRREAHRLLQSECPSADDVDPVLALLVRHGHVRPLPQTDSAGRGRPAGPAFEVHPHLRQAVPE